MTPLNEPGTRGGEYPTRTPDAVCPFPNAGPSLSHGGIRPHPGSLSGETLTPSSPLLASRDYWLLCLACGSVTAEPEWTYWQRDEDDGWRPSRPGEYDAMMRCPTCGWEHVDDDSNPGVMDGTREQVDAYRRQEEPECAEWWAERLTEMKNGLPVSFTEGGDHVHR